MPPHIVVSRALTTASPDDAGGASPVALVLAVAAALVLALMLAEVLAAVVRTLGSRGRTADALSRGGRWPLRAVLAVTGVWVAVRLVTEPPPDAPSWRPAFDHLALVATIVAVAWLLTALAVVAQEVALVGRRGVVADETRDPRVRTRLAVLRRVTIAVAVLLTVVAVLLTVETLRGWGVGLLVAAGVVGMVLVLVARRSLANLVAGLQLAFTDVVRRDDVVVVDGQWGRVEEITLTSVVVQVWDGRRLVVPSSWFTSTPVENWTRRAADLLGVVDLDVDWTVPVGEMRTELARLLQASELWDHRVGILQVTEATEGVVRVRALASAADAPTLFDLRCHVREGLVTWLQREHPDALPRSRWEQVREAPRGRRAAPPSTADGAPARAVAPGDQAQADPTSVPETTPQQVAAPQETVRLDVQRQSRLFTGSLPAVERSTVFGGPGQDVIEERERAAEGPPPTRDRPRH